MMLEQQLKELIKDTVETQTYCQYKLDNIGIEIMFGGFDPTDLWRQVQRTNKNLHLLADHILALDISRRLNETK